MVIAHTLMVKEIVGEILLVGRNQARVEAEALDMMHAAPFLNSRVQVRSGTIEQIGESDVVVMCASIPSPVDFTSRNQLARGNLELMRDLLPKVARYAPRSKLVMVTNPVDALTWEALKLTGFPPERVMGTGTLVDSMRYRQLLSETLSIHPDDIRAYILGEHGEHQFPALSVAQAAGDQLDDNHERRKLFEKARSIGIEVFRAKGNTCYAIGLSTVYIIKSLLHDECRTIPLSVKIEDYFGVSGVCLSVPVVVGKNGIQRYLLPKLNEREISAFRLAGEAVRRMIQQFASEWKAPVISRT